MWVDVEGYVVGFFVGLEVAAQQLVCVEVGLEDVECFGFGEHVVVVVG